MTHNIFKLLYIIAGFMIMLMGLFSFFEQHSQYTRYYQSVQKSQEEKNNWLIDTVWVEEIEHSKLLTYEELRIEVGGYYCFSEELIIQAVDKTFEKNQSLEGFQEFMHTLEADKKYYLNVTSEAEHLREKMVLEIIEVKE